jgi:antitoxin VapB
MSLNIKSEEAHKLAREIARETGESLTTAVTEALRERLNAVRRRRRRDTMLVRLRAISARSAAILGAPVDHGEMLYDENGLPK